MSVSRIHGNTHRFPVMKCLRNIYRLTGRGGTETSLRKDNWNGEHGIQGLEPSRLFHPLIGTTLQIQLHLSVGQHRRFLSTFKSVFFDKTRTARILRLYDY